MMDGNTTAAPAAPEFAADLLRGADQIAEFLYGDARLRRKVYNLSENSRLPVFKLGAMTCARKSVLLEWIAAQERRGWNNSAKADEDGKNGK